MKSLFAKSALVASLALTSVAAVVPNASAVTTTPKAVVPQLGINSFINYSCESDADWTMWAQNQVAAFKKMHANSIALAFPFYTETMTSNTFSAKLVCGVHSNLTTPPPDKVAEIVDIAHAGGLQVFLRPLLDETNLRALKTGNWRGLIRPSNPALWFANYSATLKPYLQMAQAHHVEHFALATELATMAANKSWATTIAAAKKLYTGDLVFTDLWTKVAGATSGGEVQWKGTSPGVDTYQWLNKSTPKWTPAQLLAGWNKALSSTNRLPFMSQAVIDEVGIVAQDGAYTAPYTWSFPVKTHPFNQTIQANWFTMVCSFYKSHHMGGVYFWGPAIYENNGNLLTKPDSVHPNQIQPLSQSAIATCFSH